MAAFVYHLFYHSICTQSTLYQAQTLEASKGSVSCPKTLQIRLSAKRLPCNFFFFFFFCQRPMNSIWCHPFTVLVSHAPHSFTSPCLLGTGVNTLDARQLVTLMTARHPHESPTTPRTHVFNS